MSVSLEPHTAQLLSQISPGVMQNSPLNLSGYGKILSSVIGALTSSLDHSPSTIDHKFSRNLKLNLPRMKESAERLRYVGIGVCKGVNTQLNLLSQEQVDRRAIHAAQQQGIRAIEQYKEFLHKTIECLPFKKQKLFTHLQPQIEELLTFYEVFICSIAPLILINPSLTAKFRSAQPVVLSALDRTLSILTEQRKVLTRCFVHSRIPIARHEALLRRIIHSTNGDTLPSLLLTIKLLKKEDPQFAHKYSVLAHMITEKYPLETIIRYSKQLQADIHSKIANLWNKLEYRLQAIE